MKKGCCAPAWCGIAKLLPSERVAGKSVSAYIDGLRMDEAKRKLLAGERVQAIAEAVGFHDVSYFLRKLKKVVPAGISAYLGKHVYLKKVASSLTKIHNFPFSLSEIVQLKPELIVTETEESFARLGKIAPTELVPYGKRHAFDLLNNCLSQSPPARLAVLPFLPLLWQPQPGASPRRPRR
ncbi:helix-turn-helix domain-containing protein [Brevibacillus agri]|uniref:helix-turn-helix domain-containing protein n=1 Tax=Brevibacillus TaxID=55080 RepID=UPI000425BCCA|nr:MULTISPECIES: helix-turn-helix domain-containing protein [Brevibacillus]MBY0050133.1 helix-turn-helix domain-containing protein [Brevibacillus agri]MED3498505.1 helix-turn-helix domain-containing protein [Brevibacillus agri]MED4570394.1 helix-turn-helix domain-containing protein [Brevibacillus agri]QHZ56635.1 AraC family transcriptional regulator [Brevibacillus sp. NSP2.1]